MTGRVGGAGGGQRGRWGLWFPGLPDYPHKVKTFVHGYDPRYRRDSWDRIGQPVRTARKSGGGGTQAPLQAREVVMVIPNT